MKKANKAEIELDDDAQRYLNNATNVRIECYLSWLITFNINECTDLIMPYNSWNFSKEFIDIEDWWYLP